MDFQSAMETFAEAWVAANTQTPLTEAAEAQALALSRSSEVHVLASPHEILIEKDSEPDGEGTRTIVNLSRSSAQDPHHAKACPKSSSATGKSIPVHCIVEQAFSAQNCDHHHQGEIPPTVELDSYAIVPSQTLFSELVRTALFKLGYASSDIIGAKGAIQIKNWKPLSFETINEDNSATVGEILGELTTVATLRIRLFRFQSKDETQWTEMNVKCVVIQLLKEMSQSRLAEIGPLSQPLISNIANDKSGVKIGQDKCAEFGRWYLHFKGTSGKSGFFQESIPSTSSRVPEPRLTFHSTQELPLLRQWYESNKNPSLDNLQTFADILNSLPIRKERVRVCAAKLKNWWKNERQRERKAPSTVTRVRRKRKQANDDEPASSTTTTT